MWIKILGCLLIIFSSTIFGYYFSDKYKKRVEELIEFQQILCFIKNEIIVFNNVIPEIFKKIEGMNELSINKVFKNVLKELKETPFCSLEYAWKNGLWSALTNLSLEVEDAEIIDSFGIMLEKTDVEGQKRNIDYMIERIQIQEEMAIEKQKKNERLIRISGILVGLAVSIVLY